MIEGEAFSILLPVRIDLHFERNIPVNNFQGGQRLIFSKYAYTVKMKKHMYLLKENHLYYKQDHLAHCFPERTEIDFERNTACNLGVSRWRLGLFPPNRPIS
jgi:hypothetical protein